MATTDSSRVTLSREELYQQVWTTPVSRLALRYGLSDVGLRKICQAHAVPVPRVGYWAKREYGKPVSQEPLLAVDDPVLETIDLRLVPEKEIERRRQSAKQLNGASDEWHVVVEETLSAPHTVVERTRLSLQSAKRGEDGLVRPRAKGCLDVAVAPNSVDRAMRILDAGLKSLEGSGFRIATDAGEHAVLALPERVDVVRLRVVESVCCEERQLTAAQRERVAIWGSSANVPLKKYQPTGELSLGIVRGEGKNAQRQTWSDSARCKLETLVGNVVSRLIRISEDLKRERAESEQRQKSSEVQEQQRLAEAEQRRAAEQRQRDEEARFKQLEEWAASWERSERLRAFLNAVERSAEACYGSLAADDDLARWLEWGRQRAAAIDPIKFQQPANSGVADETP